MDFSSRSESARDRYPGPDPGDEGDSIHARAGAARPLAWKGTSDLIQLAWAKPRRGLFLVLDHWSGLGALVVSLLAMGMRLILISAESDPSARQSLEATFHHQVVFRKVEHLSAEVLRPVLARREYRSGEALENPKRLS